MSSTKVVLLKLCILLLLYDHATSLIIPEELPTILSLIYSNIPPIKKGTDSRIGVGFRLGQHADFQVLLELGPQTETDPIGNAESKRRRDAMLKSAMRGELGPLAQAVAKYQMERKLQRELERLKKVEEKLKEVNTTENNDKKSAANEWLTKWSKEAMKSSEDEASLEDVDENLSLSVKNQTTLRIGRPPKLDHRKTTISDLTKLYKVQKHEKAE
ncbi:snustorr snarlik [Megachile rotundata]|uniref:snustorr snarlik n=1 Tax=Megachile rotundata TaxID=143995 RepID=UPI000258D7AA|nr:PREDICTED: uncharacterized protein LOC100874767 [Megachile rotundata]XP_012154246.1 PREDICTED: uncharacterized protein LOC100874767 [Megachile rotundata]XP_012154247.1 PREDICTED: uncharacterized protein LOC100874767 [Megachile rotundata]